MRISSRRCAGGRSSLFAVAGISRFVDASSTREGRVGKSPLIRKMGVGRVKGMASVCTVVASCLGRRRRDSERVTGHEGWLSEAGAKVSGGASHPHRGRCVCASRLPGLMRVWSIIVGYGRRRGRPFIAGGGTGSVSVQASGPAGLSAPWRLGMWSAEWAGANRLCWGPDRRAEFRRPGAGKVGQARRG